MPKQNIMVSATVITVIASLATGYFIGKYTSEQVRLIDIKRKVIKS
jgi:hypothetical protein